MQYINDIFVFFLGLVFGSFISALSWRVPRGISINKGRSFCDKCKIKLNWTSNIPLVSYIFLRGRCKNCGKKISARYPFIEIVSGVMFVFLYSSFPISEFIFLSFIFVLLFSIFIIDLEHKIIPDSLVYTLLLLIFINLIRIGPDSFYLNLFVGFFSGLFFLTLNLITKGKGMGLGDAKLAIPIGIYFGWPLTLVWFLSSFLTGAGLGIILILAGKAKFGKQIPFGPFLAASFFITLFWGEKIFRMLF